MIHPKTDALSGLTCQTESGFILYPGCFWLTFKSVKSSPVNNFDVHLNLYNQSVKITSAAFCALPCPDKYVIGQEMIVN